MSSNNSRDNHIEFVQLTSDESDVFKRNISGISVITRALTVESHYIEDFFSRLDELKTRDRKCARIPRVPDHDIAALRNYIERKFSRALTKQELYWLLCDYLSSKQDAINRHVS